MFLGKHIMGQFKKTIYISHTGIDKQQVSDKCY